VFDQQTLEVGRDRSIGALIQPGSMPDSHASRLEIGFASGTLH